MQYSDLRPMPPSARETVLVEGGAGVIETDINTPATPHRGFALIAHPNPLQGGTKDNKVVTTLARVFFNLGYVTLRPNFRGVGASTGEHDKGVGETEDLLLAIEYARRRFGELPVLLAGFSFGSFVQTRVAQHVVTERLVLVGPAVNRFPAETVPDTTLVIHGEHDDVVPLAAVFDWARPQNLPVVVVPGGDHFFHNRLDLLARLVLANFR
jgi:uncharacterized protein